MCHTIAKFKSESKVFKILSDLIRNMNPLSRSSDIIDPLLIPLVDRMTFSEDCKKENSDLIVFKAEESKEASERSVQDLNVSEEAGDYEFIGFELDEDDNLDNPENEDEEDEEEEEEVQPVNEVYDNENDTESENVSLDDLIEELKYEDDDEDEDEDRSESENNSGNNSRSHHSENSEMEDEEGSGSREQSMNSEDAIELFDQVDNEGIEIDHIEDMDAIFGGDGDGGMNPEFEYEFFDINNNDINNQLREIREMEINRHGMIESFEDEGAEEDDHMGNLRHLMNFLERRDGGIRRNQQMFGAGRQMRGPGYYMGDNRNRNRRDADNDRGQAAGLDTIYQTIHQNQVDDESFFWENSARDLERNQDHRARYNRANEDDENNNFNAISREIARLRALPGFQDNAGNPFLDMDLNR